MSFTVEEQKIIRNLYENHHGAPYIANQLGVKIGAVSWFIKRYIGVRSCSEAARKFTCNENFFENIDTEEKAYWLGFIYADGYVSSASKYSYHLGISLAEKDKKHLEKFKQSINATYPINIYKVSNGYNKNGIFCRILITSKKLYNDAVKQGVLEHKTDILMPPNIEECLISHFIRGYFDGDGCISHNTKRDEYTIKILGTEKILDFIKNFVENNAIAKIHCYYKRHKNDIVSNIEIGGNLQVSKFCETIYKNATIWLDRKYNRYIDLQKLIHSRAASKDIA